MTFGTDLRENFGLRSSCSVFGRWNLVVYLFLTLLVFVAPARDFAAFFAVSASFPCERIFRAGDRGEQAQEQR